MLNCSSTLLKELTQIVIDRDLEGIIIGGTTASGKSNLALELAKRFDGIIINGDALQLYKNIPILAATPDSQMQLEATHHLFSILMHYDRSCVASWLDRVKNILASNKDRFVIVVGGTGMYLHGLYNGFSSIPTVSQNIKEDISNISKNLNNIEFYEYVISVDPQIHGVLHPNDRQRLQRAIEVKLGSNISITQWQKQRTGIIDIKKWALINLLPPPQILTPFFASRIDQMINMGAIDEVAKLMELGVVPNVISDDVTASGPPPVCQAIGVKQLAAYINGEYHLNTAKELMIIASAQYAKKQRTFFKNQFNNLVYTSPYIT